ncbi:uracil-DNA glycosylase [Lodderomyces elongisporus NRRL YB-4239]|uniref:Uracil-DNA glycosylase n=1 Tax=Lodderomyces elongisporus (strain ATCC 11503 / CBS 2605 / JCM 1781 / NBRC 1676 / NRRL YB-4239) TaxID=379508 RepID=A5DZB6_LODEL|nr:uracil-DNA glycosylase [Lodderomyces elongisporus NRRL YB-4239]
MVKRPITDYFSTVTITRKKPRPEELALHIKVTEPNVNSDKETNGEKLEDDENLKYKDFCKEYKFNKTNWVNGLTLDQRETLQLEIEKLHITWLAALHQELTKPYFIKLKKFLASQTLQKKVIFPKQEDIYSWSKLTPLPTIKCLILGQDPYHNYNQAHGLAFSVLEPTRPPPSLVNIYKTLAIDIPEFVVPNYKSNNTGGGNLSKWAENGVLMLNAVLTVEAHKANSHAKQGWEQFTEEVIKQAIRYHCNSESRVNGGFVIMAWGSPAQKRVENIFRKMDKGDKEKFLVLQTVHPSPLSAHRGFFQLQVFKRCNDWLKEHDRDVIDWNALAEKEIIEEGPKKEG